MGKSAKVVCRCGKVCKSIGEWDKHLKKKHPKWAKELEGNHPMSWRTGKYQKTRG